MEKIGIVICNYNMPEATENLVSFIKDNFKTEYKLIVVDNGSEYAYEGADIKLQENLNKLGGVLAGMRELKDVSLYWNISTSTQFIDYGKDFSEELISQLRFYKGAVGITPGYTGEVYDKTNAENLAKEGSRVHETYLLGVYAMYDSYWLDSIGWFDERLTSTFGTDFETSYIARIQGRKLLVHDQAKFLVKKGPAYKMGRAGISLDDYQQQCREEMETVLADKYGKGWRRILGVEQYV